MAVYARLRAFIAGKLGRCGRCIRWSTFGALAAWTACGALWGLWPNRMLLVASIGIAVCLSLLTAMHLSVYTARVAIALRQMWTAEPAEPLMAGSEDPLLDRRRFLAKVFTAASVGFFLTLFWPLMKKAYAQYECGKGTPCGNTGYCCNPGWYYCNECNGRPNVCVPPTDEDLKQAQACCAILVRCG